MPGFDTAHALLASLGAAEIPHPGGTLLEHLVRVHHLLEAWAAPLHVQLAGLCHATYGTDGFAVALLPLDERARLVEVIGAEAESIVYRYGSCDRARTYPRLGETDVVFVDRFTGTSDRPGATATAAFSEITAANELDVVRHNPEIAARAGDRLRELMVRSGHHLSPAALAAWATSA